jgi:dihydroorotase-like cyclic amidohydrolase
MRRRKFLKKSTGLLTAVAGLSHLGAAAKSPQLQQIISGARVLFQGKLQNLNVGVDASGRLVINPEIHEGIPVIDANGKIVSPGFIDILADNASNPQKTFRTFEKYKITDGVTTALQMHGGNENVSAYYEYFSGLDHRINYGVSTFVMRIRNKYPLLKDRLRVVEHNLEQGALGVSHSIEYQPAPTEELVCYASLAKKYNRPFFLHLRYSSESEELSGVDEAIHIARQTGVSLHIDHLNSTGGTFHMAEALRKIRSANQTDTNITCCVYPYSYWATYLHSKRFDEGWRERYGLDYSDLRLVGSGERLTRESFYSYRKMMKLAAVPEGTMPLDRTVDLALQEDFCMIGSDGGIEKENQANSHPRGAGCFSTAVRHGLSIGMSIEKILEKITTTPRNLILPAMQNRGLIAEGFQADLVVFDPEQINGQATVANPNKFSAGINLVLVKGKIAYQEGRLLQSAGEAIKY